MPRDIVGRLVVAKALMIQSRPWQRSLAAGSICGAAVWAFSIPFTGMREPFDSPSMYYPAAMFLSGIAAALVAPRFWWLAVIGIFLGERLYAFAILPETREWLLAGVVINLLLPTWLPAMIGSMAVFAAHRWLTRRSSWTSTRRP